MQYIKVITAKNRAEAELYQGLLQASGIHSVIIQDTQSGALRAAYGGASLPFETWAVTVRPQDKERAAELLSKPDVSTTRTTYPPAVRIFSAIIILLFVAGMVFGIIQIIQYFKILNH